MGDLPVLPTPPWDKLSVCADGGADHLNVPVDPAELDRPGRATGCWWHANRISTSVFVDLTDWTDGPRVLARYVLNLDGSIDVARWEDGVDPYALAAEALR